jgi:hypothetical protein
MPDEDVTMANLPKTAAPTAVIGYTIEYTIATNKVVYATNDNAHPKKYESSSLLSEDEVSLLCEETVTKANLAFAAGNPDFKLMITPAGKIYNSPKPW